MRYFLLFCVFACTSYLAKAQIFTTTKSGNFTASSTWVLNSIPPNSTSTNPGSCNCQIIVSSGHTLTLDQNFSITGANFVLDGTNSVLTFSNNVIMTMVGTNSSINVKSGAKITKGNNSNTIILGGVTIFDGKNTKVNTTTGGLVLGPASASASRAGGPQFINSVLPVKLSEFKATSNGSKVILNWTTEQERNSGFYQVERSNDGKSFSTIAIVSASGNSDIQLKYSYIDNTPLAGENYYRLKIVDQDAKFEFSPIKSINIDLNSSALSTSPNPASTVLNITVNEQSIKDYQLKLINRTGQILFSRKYSGNVGRISIPVSSFPGGSYFVELIDTKGMRVTKSVVIVRDR